MTVTKQKAKPKGKMSKPTPSKSRSAAESFYLKTHVSRFSTILAVCDRQCLGRKFESGGLILDLETHRRFYDGELVSEAAVLDALASTGNINIVGDRAVGLACTALGIPKASAKKIGGVLHLQVYKV